MSLPFITSAPGKVIIFGEHSAVFNEPAIAASVASLRTYLLISKSKDPDVIELDFPDIKFDHKWLHTGLEIIDPQLLQKATVSKELVPELTAALEPLLSSLVNSLHHHAAYCFLYLYLCLCPTVKGVKFTLKSTLPIGAGLGSSASISVCLALAMAKLGNHITTAQITREDKQFVNDWSFIGEKCIHGTPSGIDNAVATYGNAVLFKRQFDGTTTFEPIHDFPQIPMVLTNTKIPKSTKILVAGVRDLVTRSPKIAKPILTSMGHIATRGALVLSQIDKDDDKYDELLELVRINHGLLVSLGVSHPGLELVKSLSDSLGVGSTKLTGAGGGGCSLTLLKKDASNEQIQKFKTILESTHKYETFNTPLGGIGCSFIPSDSLSLHVDSVDRLFNEPVTQQELTDFLLPGKSMLSWIH